MSYIALVILSMLLCMLKLVYVACHIYYNKTAYKFFLEGDTRGKHMQNLFLYLNFDSVILKSLNDLFLFINRFLQ